MNRTSIIQQIMEHHPGYGVDKGYSVYVGGMTDTGHWLQDKLEEAPLSDLTLFLDYLLREKEKVKRNYEEMMRIRTLPEEEQKTIRLANAEKEKQALIDLAKELENYLMWGKSI